MMGVASPMSRRVLPFVFLAGLLANPALAVPLGDAAAGKEKSAPCAACHGPQGNASNAAFPKLAGQYADYLLYSLKAYKSGGRQNPVMAGQVANLSEQDMRDLAAYFASQPGDLTVLER